MNEYNNILNNLEILKLEKMRSYLPNYLEEITSKKIPFQKAFLELTVNFKFIITNNFKNKITDKVSNKKAYI